MEAYDGDEDCRSTYDEGYEAGRESMRDELRDAWNDKLPRMPRLLSRSLMHGDSVKFEDADGNELDIINLNEQLDEKTRKWRVTVTFARSVSAGGAS